MGDINFLADKSSEDKHSKEGKPTDKRGPDLIRFHVPNAKPEQPESKRPPFMVRLKTQLQEISAGRKRTKTKIKVRTDKKLKETQKQPKPAKDESQARSVIPAKPPVTPEVAPKEPPTPALTPTPAAHKQSAPVLAPDKSAQSAKAGQQAPEDEEFNEVDINLIPLPDTWLKRRRQLRAAALAGSVLVIAIWGILLRIQNSTRATHYEGLRQAVSELDSQLETIDTTLLSEGSGIAIRQRKLVSLLSSVPRWSKFIAWLESITEPGVFFESASVKEDGNIDLKAVAPDFTTAARQWIAFSTATSWVSQVDISEVLGSESSVFEDGEGGEPSVSFSVKLKIFIDQLKEGVDLETL